MKRTERVLTIIAILAIVISFFHLPGVSILIVLSFSFLSILYFFAGFALFNNLQLSSIFKKESYKGIPALRIILGIFTGAFLNIAATAMLFKFQVWPGVSTFFIVAIVGLFVILLIALFNLNKKDHTFYQGILVRVVPYFVVCIFLFSIPNKSWLNWKYPDHPEYVQAILDARADPDNPELRERVNEEREKILKAEASK